MSNQPFDKKIIISTCNSGSNYIDTARILCDRCYLCDRCMDIPMRIRTSDLCSACINETNETNNQHITSIIPNISTNMMQKQFRN